MDIEFARRVCKILLENWQEIGPGAVISVASIGESLGREPSRAFMDDLDKLCDLGFLRWETFAREESLISITKQGLNFADPGNELFKAFAPALVSKQNIINAQNITGSAVVAGDGSASLLNAQALLDALAKGVDELPNASEGERATLKARVGDLLKHPLALRLADWFLRQYPGGGLGQ